MQDYATLGTTSAACKLATVDRDAVAHTAFALLNQGYWLRDAAPAHHAVRAQGRLVARAGRGRRCRGVIVRGLTEQGVFASQHDSVGPAALQSFAH